MGQFSIGDWVSFAAALTDAAGGLSAQLEHDTAEAGNSWRSALQMIDEMKTKGGAPRHLTGLPGATFRLTRPEKNCDIKLVDSIWRRIGSLERLADEVIIEGLDVFASCFNPSGVEIKPPDDQKILAFRTLLAELGVGPTSIRLLHYPPKGMSPEEAAVARSEWAARLRLPPENCVPRGRGSFGGNTVSFRVIAPGNGGQASYGFRYALLMLWILATAAGSTCNDTGA